MKRDCGVDLLKFFCSFMIICIHSPFPGVLGYIVTPLCRIAVPLFLMITGYYYSRIKEQNKELLQIRKIFRKFVYANLLYFLFSFFVVCIKRGSIVLYLNEIIDIKSLIKFIILNSSPFGEHLWYLGAVLYVLLVVLFVEKKRDRKLLYPFVPLLLMIDLIFGKYSLLFFNQSFSPVLVRNFLFVGMPYFLLGDMICRYKVKINSKKVVYFFWVFVGTTLTERFLLGKFNLNAARDHYISTTFLAVTVFLLAVRYERKKIIKIQTSMCFVGEKMSSYIHTSSVVSEFNEYMY